MPSFNNSFSSNVNANSYQINSLLDPSLPQDGATKNYIDTVKVHLKCRFLFFLYYITIISLNIFIIYNFRFFLIKNDFLFKNNIIFIKSYLIKTRRHFNRHFTVQIFQLQH